MVDIFLLYKSLLIKLLQSNQIYTNNINVPDIKHKELARSGFIVDYKGQKQFPAGRSRWITPSPQ